MPVAIEWRECDVCIPYAAIAANKRHIQKRHENFIVARGSEFTPPDCANGIRESLPALRERKSSRGQYGLPRVP